MIGAVDQGKITKEASGSVGPTFVREAPMALTAAQLEQQKQQAEELLFSGPQTLGFRQGPVLRSFQRRSAFSLSAHRAEEQSRVNEKVDEVRRFAEEHIDAAAIDRNADIPRRSSPGLGRLGVLGMTAPTEFGGRGFSQLANCRIMEMIGGH